jgi:hypothetical protein
MLPKSLQCFNFFVQCCHHHWLWDCFALRPRGQKDRTARPTVDSHGLAGHISVSTNDDSKLSGLWHCVITRVIPDVSKYLKYRIGTQTFLRATKPTAEQMCDPTDFPTIGFEGRLLGACGWSITSELQNTQGFFYRSPTVHFNCRTFMHEHIMNFNVST